MYDIVEFIKNHMVLVIIWFLLLSMVLYTMVMHWIHGNCEISCDDAVFLINKNQASIIDIRNRNEYDAGYIINSVNIPFADIKKSDIFLCRKFKDNPLIVVHNNMISSSYSAKKYLNKLGFMKVYVLKGGVYAWKNSNFPLLSKK